MPYFPEVNALQGADRTNIVLYAFIGAIVLISLVGFASAYISSRNLINDQFDSGTLKVTCSGCSGVQKGSYQFSGSYSINLVAIVHISGNGTQSYMISRSPGNRWIVSWGVNKNTEAGTLEVKFTLSNGTIVFDQTTDSPYSSIVGIWSYTAQ